MQRFYDSEEGLYYTCDEPEKSEFLARLSKSPLENPTDLKGFFNRKLEVCGLDKDKMTIFFIGETEDLFGKTYYFKPVLVLSENRFYICHHPNHGRDYNYINGEWH